MENELSTGGQLPAPDYYGEPETNETPTEQGQNIPIPKKQSPEPQVATLQQVENLRTELGDKTSLFGINTGDLLAGSVVVELILFAVIFFLIYLSNDEKKRLSRMIDKQKEKIEELTRKVERLESNAAQQKISPPVTNWYAPPPPVPEIQRFSEPRPIEPQLEPRPITPANKYDNFVKDFNALAGQSGINLKNARNDFMRKYNVQTFTCTNFEARMNEPVPAPVFDSANALANPDYWAYEFATGVFAVVPKVKTYSDNYHTARAMGEVFKSNFIAGRTYNKIRVNKPAIFRGMWNFEQQGELELS